MRYPVLAQYLARLADPAATPSSLWLDAAGRAHGRFFNCTMTSVFHPVRELAGGAAVACEGLARGISAEDEGLSLWRLLENAASDDESVELDRLCRMLHAINFFRQPECDRLDLHLNVHGRLLSAVSSNHGHAFRRILDALELPASRIVLQLPAATPQQNWLLGYVADNYRRNGFRFAVNVGSAQEGLALLERVRPDLIRADARAARDAAGLARLLGAAAERGARVLFHHAEGPAALAALDEIAALAGTTPLVQGYALDQPRAALPATAVLAAA
ncbi:EAL domain-containing protein (putative c-di-GMP-specific phosphodiesterase class I) [Pseudoduganella flava]|uniref:EAL domain-containing protein n=1 Tax=Pseudoduganella flava TaxID=871742 RepID=A0A562PZX5_9BURK|nr:EAL domain-containing protein [Pseudoduganella flava]QGZ38459.1 EAL domain-containing protein [Pseudoduganella flava]TWI49991.1 EAL domain-containing protein (putative c-di-GMP-specific phosphodiesterase class I) [Pseudoduganella flava]